MPFDYPAVPHVRRHGPSGYRDYDSFRPWLRDEFCFHCVYCLRRETWDPTFPFEIDHFVPQALDPTQGATYSNLLYSCSRCNARKLDQLIPDPLQVMLSDAVVVGDDGYITGKTNKSLKLIRTLGLDSELDRKFRCRWIQVLKLARSVEPHLYRELLGFPDDLPNLATLRPQTNSLPLGISESWYAMRAANNLPETFLCTVATN